MTFLGVDGRGWYPQSRNIPGPVPETAGAPLLAYSLRRVVNGYSGAAVRLMRVPGGTEQDFGFDAQGRFDEDAFVSWVGSSDALVRKLYNQGTAGSGGDFNADPAYMPLFKLGSARFTFGPFSRPSIDPNEGSMFIANDAVAKFTDADMTMMAVIVPGTRSTAPEHVIGFNGHWSVRSIPTMRSSFRYKASDGSIKLTSGDANQLVSDRPTRFSWRVSRSGSTVTLVRRIAGRQDTYSFPGGWSSSYQSGDPCSLFGRGGGASIFSGWAAEVMVWSPGLSEQQVLDVESGQIAYYGVA